MPQVHQASIGVERQVTSEPQRPGHLPDASRPPPDSLDQHQRAGRVRQPAGPDASARSRSSSPRDGPIPIALTFGGNYRFPQRRIFVNMNYTLGRVKNHTDSETSLPANNLDPDAEWGYSRQDVRHRLQGTVNVPLVLGLRANVNINAQSATPYTITTGRDDNGDGTSNDRPAGRRSQHRAWHRNLRDQPARESCVRAWRSAHGRWFPRWRWPTGRSGRWGVGPGGPAGGAGASVGQTLMRRVKAAAVVAVVVARRGGNQGDAAFNARYMMELFVTADNVFNRVNYGGYSGNLLSDYFGQPTMAQRPRQVQVGMQFRF